MNLRNKHKPLEETGFYDAYAGFARILRAWLVAYGIGVPVLFASQPAFATILQERHAAVCIICIFLTGVSLQAIAALLYKATMWYLYFGESDSEFQKTKRYKVASWLSVQLWLELGFDLFSIAMFAWATTWMLLRLVTQNA